MKNRFSQLTAILLCLISIGVFWSVKGNRKTFLPGAKFTSNIAPLKDSEIGANALELQEAFVKVAERIKPAIVNISAIQTIEYPQQEFYFGDPFEDFFQDYFNSPQDQPRLRKKPNQYKSESGGTGVIIDPEGYILTNEHVIHGADEIKVTVTMDGQDKTYTGKVIGKDVKTDLAIVKINSAGKLSAAPLGDSDKIRVGEWVIAIGSPFGLGQTVTNGIVSALRQSIMVENKEYSDFIQTDAAINKGNSGGALCNIHGEIIGINTAIYAPTGVFAGIGFAIPINRAKEVMDDLIHRGKVTRGWLGVEITPVDSAIQKQFDLKNMNGALVNSVLKDSPADKSGIKRGDVIIEFNKKAIDNVRSLQSIAANTGPKKTIKVKFIRNGRELTADLTTGEMPDETAPKESGDEKEEKHGSESASWLGMNVTALNSQLAQKYDIPQDESGVVIVKIEAGAQIAQTGLAVGDLIKSINRVPTPDITSFKKATKSLKLSDGIVFDILRQGKPAYLSYSKD